MVKDSVGREGQYWGDPFCLGYHQTVEHGPGRKQGRQKPWLERQGGLASGSVDSRLHQGAACI